MTAACKTASIHDATKNDDVDDVKCHVDNGIDVNQKSFILEYTPLYVSAITGSSKVMKYLIEQQHADVNARNTIGQTPFHILCRHDRTLDNIKYFIEKGADVDAKDIYGDTPLHYAVLHGTLDIVKYLIENGHVDVNVTNDDGDTPLHYASKKGDFEMVMYLVEKGAFVNAKNKAGQTPLLLATIYNKNEVTEYLKSKLRKQIFCLGALQ